jgi:hypothetical protein
VANKQSISEATDLQRSRSQDDGASGGCGDPQEIPVRHTIYPLSDARESSIAQLTHYCVVLSQVIENIERSRVAMLLQLITRRSPVRAGRWPVGAGAGGFANVGSAYELYKPGAPSSTSTWS